MRNLGKRGLALLLSLLMVVSLVPTAFAENAVPEEETVSLEETATAPEETAGSVVEEEVAPSEEEAALPADEEVANDSADGATPPATVTAANGENGIHITWSSVGSGVTYTVYRKLHSAANWSYLADCTTTEYVDNPGTDANGTYYDYTVGVAGSTYQQTNYAKNVRYIAPVTIKSTQNLTIGIEIDWNANSVASWYHIQRKSALDSTWMDFDGSTWSNSGTVSPVTGTTFTDTNAFYNIEYTYRLIAVDSNGTLGSYDTNGKTTIRLSTPEVSEMTVKNAADGVEFSWTTVASASSYVIYRKTSGAGVWTRLGTANTPPYTDRTAVTGTTYYYSVSAYDVKTDTEGVYSTNGVYLTYLAAPALVSATVNGTSIIVTWGSVKGADSYDIWRREEGTTFVRKFTNKTGTSFTDTTAKSGVLYYYTVSCKSGDIESAYNTVGILACALPTPVLVGVANETSGISFQWNEVSSIKYYTIYRKSSTDSSFSYLTRINVSEVPDSTTTLKDGVFTYLDKSAEEGKTYTYTVASAYVSADKISSKDRVGTYDTTGLTITRLAVPAMKAIENLTGGIHMTWNAVSGATSYIIYRSLDGVSYSNYSTSTTTEFTDTSVDSGTKYYYTIAAVAEVNGIKTVGLRNAYGLNITRLLTVAFYLDNVETGIKINWNPIKGAAYYRVYRSIPGTPYWDIIYDKSATEAATDGYLCIDTGRVNGKSYTYTVRAYVKNADGDEELSYYDPAGKSIVRSEMPKVTKVFNWTNGVMVYWDAAGDTAVSGYHVYCKIDGGDWVSRGTTTNKFYCDTNVSSGHKYQYTVRAIINGVESGYETASTEKNTTIFISTPTLNKAYNSKAATNKGAITIEWYAVDGADYYNVYRKIKGYDWEEPVKTTNTYYTDSTASIGTTYVYTVRAHIAGGSDGYLSWYDMNGKTVQCVATTDVLDATGSVNGVVVKWSPVAGTDVKYYIWRRTATGDWPANPLGYIVSSSNATLTYVDSSASAGTEYYYTVRAEVNGYMGWFDETGESAMFLATPKVTTMANKVFTSGGSSKNGITFSWNTVSGATGYDIYYRVDGGSWIGPAHIAAENTASQTYNWTASLTTGKTYTFTVRATWDGTSSRSMSWYSVENVNSIVYVAAPTVFSKEEISLAAGGVTFEWQPVTGVDFYGVWRQQPGGDWQLIGTTTGTEWTDPNAVAGTQYYYTAVSGMRDLNSGIYSGYVDPGIIITPTT